MNRRDRQCPTGCGACCDPVVLPYGPADLSRATARMSAEDRRFVIDHLTPISRSDGLAATPYLKGATMGLVDGEVQIAWSWFYRCDLYDTDAHRCTDYEHRPAMCREYPWYGDGPDPAKALPFECVYRDEIPVALSPTRSGR